MQQVLNAAAVISVLNIERIEFSASCVEWQELLIDNDVLILLLNNAELKLYRVCQSSFVHGTGSHLCMPKLQAIHRTASVLVES